MAIKSCTRRIATNCYGTQTIQPPRSNAFVQWICPECARMLAPKVESIDLTKGGGKDAQSRLVAQRARRTASSR